jgi:hypothetical protein
MQETWDAELVNDVGRLLDLMDEIAAEDGRLRPYDQVREEMAADRFVTAHRVARTGAFLTQYPRTAPIDEGFVMEVMSVLASSADYMRSEREVRCTGGVVALAGRSSKSGPVSPW